MGRLEALLCQSPYCWWDLSGLLVPSLSHRFQGDLLPVDFLCSMGYCFIVYLTNTIQQQWPTSCMGQVGVGVQWWHGTATCVCLSFDWPCASTSDVCSQGTQVTVAVLSWSVRPGASSVIGRAGCLARRRRVLYVAGEGISLLLACAGLRVWHQRTPPYSKLGAALALSFAF